MSELWKPPNIRALPTPNEIKLAQESIEILEGQLQNAVAAPLSAKQAVATLQRQIDERRSWIAPIRRIPHDVISMIFLEMCQVDWSAPVILSHVCHRWRESIIATPLAWSYFQLKESQSYELRSLFLSRSAPCYLHLRLPFRLDTHTSRLLASMTERIKCLSMDIAHVSFLRDNRFPALERLRVSAGLSTARSDTESGFILNSDLFPRLRSLYTHVFLEEMAWRKPPLSRFVPLQAFSVTATDPQFWSMIVENCCESLTSLSVRFYNVVAPIFDRKVVLLPRLKYLSINSYYTNSIPWCIDARTPALQAYAETSRRRGLVGPTHEDTKTVIHLIFNGDIDLSKFPQIRQIMFGAVELDKVMGRLMEAPEICPNLETITDGPLGGDSLVRAKELIATRNRQTGGNIQFGRGREDGVYSYRGSIPFNCGYDMPCSFR